MIKSYAYRIQEEQSIQKANDKLIRKLESDYQKIYDTFANRNHGFGIGEDKPELEALEKKFAASIYKGLTQYFKDLGLPLEITPESISAFKDKAKLKENIQHTKKVLKKELGERKTKLVKDYIDKEMIKNLEEQIAGLDLLLKDEKVINDISKSLKEINNCAKEGAKSIERLRIQTNKSKGYNSAEEEKERLKYINMAVKAVAGLVVIAAIVLVLHTTVFPIIPIMFNLVTKAGFGVKNVIETFDEDKKVETLIKDRLIDIISKTIGVEDKTNAAETALDKNQKQMAMKVKMMSNKLNKASRALQNRKEPTIVF